jgi:hypothetical protein
VKKIILIGALIVFFIFPKLSFATVQVSVSDVPSSIGESSEFQASVFLSCSGCADSYLRGVFYPSGSSYFGYTKDNNGNWINASGSNCTSYFKICSSDLSEGSWSGKLTFKSDTQSSFYNGSGEYLFKVGRYTPSCGSPTWSSESTISIIGPTKTPTPAPTSAPTDTQVPTKTPTPTKSPTPSPTKSISPTATNLDELVLGKKSLDDKSPTPVLTKTQVVVRENPNRTIAIIFVIGSVFLIVCVILWVLISEKKIFKRNE